MPGFNFEEYYRAAFVETEPPLLKQRSGPFDKLRKEKSAARMISLTRMLFGLKEPDGYFPDWFKAPFVKVDGNFSEVNNDREIRVLASGLLLAAMYDSDNVAAGLALLTTSAAENRKILDPGDILKIAEDELGRIALQRRKKFTDTVSSLLPIRTVSNVSAPAAENPEGISTFIDKINQQKKDVLAYTREITSNVSDCLAAQQEELEMLWWYIGGWSRTLNKPFQEFGPATRAILAGLDFASLAHNPPGPYAAPAILERLIVAGQDDPPSQVTIKEAVEGLSPEEREKVASEDVLENITVLCPVHTALRVAVQNGNGGKWHKAFYKITGIKDSATFNPRELAMQVYREAMLAFMCRGEQ